MRLFDKVKSLLGRGSDAEAIRELAATDDFIPANRRMIRAVERANRKHGAGYTRQLRKGRREHREFPS